MVKNGLEHNKENVLFEIFNAQKQFNLLQESLTIKKYNSALQNATSFLTQALKEKDIFAILYYEKIFQDYDIERTIDSEKRLSEMTGIIYIHETFEKGKTFEYAKELYSKTYPEGSRKPSKFVDYIMDKAIKSRCRSLGVLASGLANNVERVFYTTRQNCLRFINKEHQKNINQFFDLF